MVVILGHYQDCYLEVTDKQRAAYNIAHSISINLAYVT